MFYDQNHNLEEIFFDFISETCPPPAPTPGGGSSGDSAAASSSSAEDSGDPGYGGPSGGGGSGGGGTGTVNPVVNDPCVQRASITNRNTSFATSRAELMTIMNATPGTNKTEQGRLVWVNSVSGPPQGFHPSTISSGSSQHSGGQWTWPSNDASWGNSNFTIGSEHTHPDDIGPSVEDVLTTMVTPLYQGHVKYAPTDQKDFFKQNTFVAVHTPDYDFYVTVKNWDVMTDKVSQNWSVLRNAFSSAQDEYLSTVPNIAPVDKMNASLYALKTAFGDAINLYAKSTNATAFHAVTATKNSANNPITGEVPCP